MKTFAKKQHGMTLIELMIVLSIIGVLSSISVAAYREYMVDVKWAKTIAGLRGLKLAVENCLSDKNSIYGECDSLDGGKVGAYGVHEYQPENNDFSSIVLEENTAAIKITGKSPLSYCILKIKPSFTVGDGGVIRWNYYMSDVAGTDVNRCTKHVKGSLASS